MSHTSTDKIARYGTPRQKVPAFARFKGTSFFKKFPRRAREYARFKAAQNSTSAATPAA